MLSLLFHPSHTKGVDWLCFFKRGTKAQRAKVVVDLLCACVPLPLCAFLRKLALFFQVSHKGTEVQRAKVVVDLLCACVSLSLCAFLNELALFFHIA